MKGRDAEDKEEQLLWGSTQVCSMPNRVGMLPLGFSLQDGTSALCLSLCLCASTDAEEQLFLFTISFWD